MTFTIRNFVLHTSIAKPLGEGGKLQLTSDMTELEFALNAFISEAGTQSKHGVKLDIIGEEYRTLRAMRFVNIAFLNSSPKAYPLPSLDLYFSSRTAC